MHSSSGTSHARKKKPGTSQGHIPLPPTYDHPSSLLSGGGGVPIPGLERRNAVPNSNVADFHSSALHQASASFPSTAHQQPTPHNVAHLNHPHLHPDNNSTWASASPTALPFSSFSMTPSPQFASPPQPVIASHPQHAAPATHATNPIRRIGGGSVAQYRPNPPNVTFVGGTMSGTTMPSFGTMGYPINIHGVGPAFQQQPPPLPSRSELYEFTFPSEALQPFPRQDQSLITSAFQSPGQFLVHPPAVDPFSLLSPATLSASSSLHPTPSHVSLPLSLDESDAADHELGQHDMSMHESRKMVRPYQPPYGTAEEEDEAEAEAEAEAHEKIRKHARGIEAKSRGSKRGQYDTLMSVLPPSVTKINGKWTQGKILTAAINTCKRFKVLEARAKSLQAKVLTLEDENAAFRRQLGLAPRSDAKMHILPTTAV